ncbi:MAG: LuxR C-terminal-related transcriptional regulator [Muriicola sp.]
MKHTLLFFIFLNFLAVRAQYQFKGQLTEEDTGKIIYLSIIEDYRRSSRVYLDQVIGRTSTDSLGNFVFEGDNLSELNNIYRIHTDECLPNEIENTHFLGNCGTTQSILFIASNTDSVLLPKTLNDESFCAISSTNVKSELLLKILALKNEMAFDFSEIRGDASKKLNLKKWFSRWHQFGEASQEPLAELFIYGFLSDRQSETYRYYLEDLALNPYYEALLDRLKTSYPTAAFTKLYEEELRADQYLIDMDVSSDQTSSWWIYLLLGLSILLNTYFLLGWKKRKNDSSQVAQLSAQEERIARAMAHGKTNKEIAQEFFISLSTVKTHVNSIYKKLNVNTREEIKTILFK